MSWKDWLCAAIIILGILMFLYGANYYDNTVGWTGVFLIAGGILAVIVLYIHGVLSRRVGPQNVPETQNP